MEANAENFTQEIEPWNVSINNARVHNYSIKCAGKNYLGGVWESPTTIEKRYSIQQTHKSISIFLVFAIELKESYQNQVHITVLDESRSLHDKYFFIPGETNRYLSSIIDCGNFSESIREFFYMVQLYHSSQTLRLLINFDKPYSRTYLGVRDFKVLISNNSLKEDGYYCITSFSGVHWLFSDLDSCSCLAGNFWGSNLFFSSCYTCDRSCLVCGLENKNCLSCAEGYFFNGDNCIKCKNCQTCLPDKLDYCLTCAGSQYLTPNNTCISDCHEPYVIKVINQTLHCTFICETHQYYHNSNRSCSESCNPPFKSKIYQFGGRGCYQPCPSSQYLFPNTTCSTHCPEPWKVRNEIDSIYCDFPCNSTSYLYWNGTCLPSCELPFQKNTTKEGIAVCNHPCLSHYLFPNTTCLDRCPEPWKVRNEIDFMYCDFPCNSTSYLYWNGTCLPFCDPPFKKITDGNLHFCNHLCPNITNYLYPNESCSTFCHLPFIQKTEGDLKLCQSPCSSNDYLLQNGSCIPSCPSPMMKEVRANVSICKSACTDQQPYYHLEKKSCLSSCPDQYESISHQNLYTVCSPIQQKDIQSINSISGASDTAATVGLAVAGAVSPSDPGSVSASMLAKMLQYVKYINISYSERLEKTFKFHQSIEGPFKIGPKMPDNLINRFQFREIPARFAKFHVHSNFLINFWDSLIFLGIISSVLIIVRIVEWIASKIRKEPKPDCLIRKIRTAIQNFFFMQFYNSFGDVLLFFGLEAKNIQLDSVLTIIVFILSIFFGSFGLALICRHFLILRKYQAIKAIDSNSGDNKHLPALTKHYEGSQIYFAQFKDTSFITQSFLFFFVVRTSLFNLVLAFLPSYPLMQTVIIFILTSGMFLYLIIKRPFKDRANLVQQLICEAIFLIVNSSLVFMAVLDSYRSESTSTRQSLGEIMIYSSLVFSFVPTVFLVIKVIIAAIDFLKSRQAKKNKTNQKLPKISNPRKNPLPNLNHFGTIKLKPKLPSTGKQSNLPVRQNVRKINFDNLLDSSFQSLKGGASFGANNHPDTVIFNDSIRNARITDCNNFRKLVNINTSTITKVPLEGGMSIKLR